MRVLSLPAVVAGLAMAMAAPAGAVSISVTTFSAADFASVEGGLAAVNAREDFEGLATGERFGPLPTAVGTFESLGGVGSGGTVTGTPGNTGAGLFLRDAPVFGRVNTTVGGASFLDSNDTLGMGWTVSGLGLFDTLLFTLSDVGDTGGNLTVSSGGAVLETILKGRSGGLVDMVLISFGGLVDEATISLQKSKLNDGFAIDDVVVGASVAPVPLPPAGLALMAGLGALALAARRRRAARY